MSTALPDLNLDALTDRRNLRPYLYVIPALIVYAVFMLYPVTESFVLSFHRFTTFNTPNEFVGLSNYQTVLADPLFWRSLLQTGIFSVGLVFLPATIGLALALLLDRYIGKATIFQTLIFSPLIMPIVVAGLLFTWIFNTQGILNYLLMLGGLIQEPISWLSSQYSLLTIVLMTIWKRTGYYMIILFAGLQGIPDEMYEVAKVLGKSRLKTFRHVTLPLLKPAIIVVVVIGVIDSIKLFGHVWVMTKGGPAHSSEILSTYFYKKTFVFFNLGEGAAVGFIMLLIALLLSTIVVKQSGFI